MLINVWCKKFKKKQACKNAKPMLWMTRTVNQTNVLICGQWSHQYMMTRNVNLPSFTRITVCDSKNCPSTKCYKKKKSVNYEEGQVRPVCDKKNCQSTMFINMWSMTKPNNMWLPKLAIQSKYNKLCNDKNCQSAKCVLMQQTAMLQSIYKRGSSKNCQVKYELA